MLYLNPPFPMIDGVSLFPDHGDPLQWYFMPMAPRFTMIQDASGQPAPSLEVIKYRGRAGSGGFLDFDVNVGIDQDRLDSVAQELQSALRLNDRPRLAPVPLVDGSVRMMLFGQASGPPEVPKGPAGAGATPPAPQPITVTVATPAAADQPQFVLKIDQATKPSLYGDNQATFSVQLDQYGVTVLEQALQGVMSPIGIVYSLSYLALRPAYHVKATADWNRVQTHLETSLGVNTIFYSSEVDKVVDKLVDDRVIDIQADTFVAGGAGDDDVIGRRDAALNEIRELVLNTFFTTSLDPTKKEKDGWDKAADFVQRTSQLAATGGMGSLVSYKEVDLTRIDQKTLNFDMSERTAVLRSIYPQGHLAGLVTALAGGKLDESKFVIAVDIDSPWFERRKLKVFTNSNLANDGVDSIQVELDYGGDKKTVLLDGTNTSRDVEWSSHLSGGAMVRPVQMSYTVNFASGLAGRPTHLTSTPRTLDGDAVQVTPRELYTLLNVPIADISFPWATYPVVEIEARYTDPEHSIDIHDAYLVRQTDPPGVWPIVAIDPARTSFSYKLTFHAADGQRLVRDWTTTDEPLIRLEDPYPSKLRFSVVTPTSLFATVDRAFVDLSYEDPANGISDEASFEFSAEHAETQTFVVDLVDRTLRRVSYKATLLFTDGRTVEVPLTTTQDSRVIIRADMKGHRMVDVHTDADFAAQELRKIDVEARYQDPDAQLSFTDNLTLTSSSDRPTFEYDYVDDAKQGFEYRVTYQYMNGMSRTVDWTPSRATDLMVHVPQ